VLSIAAVITGVVCGLNVLSNTGLIEGDSSWELCNAYIFNDSEREHSIRCDADGVTVITIQRKY